MEQVKAQKTTIDWTIPKKALLLIIASATLVILVFTIIERVADLQDSHVTYWAKNGGTNNGFSELLINNPNAIPGFTLLTYNIPLNNVELKENKTSTILTTTPSAAWRFGALMRDTGSPVLPSSVIPDDSLQYLDYTYTEARGLTVLMKNRFNVIIEINPESTPVAPKKHTTPQRTMAWLRWAYTGIYK